MGRAFISASEISATQANIIVIKGPTAVNIPSVQRIELRIKHKRVIVIGASSSRPVRDSVDGSMMKRAHCETSVCQILTFDISKLLLFFSDHLIVPMPNRGGIFIVYVRMSRICYNRAFMPNRQSDHQTAARMKENLADDKKTLCSAMRFRF